jgi:hypothetical protein
MTLDDYLAAACAAQQILPGYHGVIDAFLERQGLQRNVVVESALLRPDPLHAGADRPGADHRQPVRASMKSRCR